MSDPVHFIIGANVVRLVFVSIVFVIGFIGGRSVIERRLKQKKE
jgi:exosortase/archaeosortase